MKVKIEKSYDNYYVVVQSEYGRVVRTSGLVTLFAALAIKENWV